jgi:cell division protein ZipA
MPELRWTLLIIGVLFIVSLAVWERRRPHQASRQAPHIGEDPRPVVTDGWDSPAVGTAAAREPSLTLPEIRADARTDLRSPAPTPPPPVHFEREPTSPKELPVVEIEADEDVEVELAQDVGPVVIVDPPAVDLPPPPTEIPKPIVDWPPEDQRKIVSLRLVARPPDRFRGNLVRQALAAEGFLFGDFEIFHKPDVNNRAVLSASNLSKPGTFDLETMDTQRFVGLSLIAVLPGPKSPQKAFEDLLLTARMLNERLEGALQDDKGGPLTPMRIQALRDSLGAEAKS